MATPTTRSNLKATKKPGVQPDKTQEGAPAGVTVILGGKEFYIRPLVIRDSREWRYKAASFQAAIAKYASVNSDDPEVFEKALTELLTKRIDETADIFFDYARDLDREAIEGIATDAEIAKALNEVNTLAFPFKI